MATRKPFPKMGRRPNPDELATVERFTPLVRKIAGGFQRKLPRNVLREDLIAAGMSGLWEAIRRHPDGPGESFEWYVRARVRGAILDELRAQDWLPRRARAKAGVANVLPPAVIRFDDVSQGELERACAQDNGADDAAASNVIQEILLASVAGLPERERYIVNRHYYEGAKFKDIGVELGVSEPRVSQIHARAMDRLRDGGLRAALQDQ